MHVMSDACINEKMTIPGGAGKVSEKKEKFRLYSYLVPGFLFQSIIIGGGYGTGNEIAQYFGIHGISYGIIGMIITTLVWSIIAAITFEFCRVFKTYDYNSMSYKLLGRIGFLYEVCYIILLLICLGVANATAGRMTVEFTGLSQWIGIAVLSAAVIFLVLRDTGTFESVLSFWSYVLYAVYPLPRVPRVTCGSVAGESAIF
jgi:uncharacterized membrane protein YkvI